MNALDILEAAQQGGIDPLSVLTPDEIAELEAMGIDLTELDLSSGVGHYDNLVGNPLVDQQKVSRLGQDVLTWVRDDEAARKPWIDMEKKALKALGISKEAHETEYEGATNATHPLFIEAVEQVHNRALIELRPPNGKIVKTIIMGEEDQGVRSQAERVEGFMNYQYTQAIPDEFNEMDRLLFRLPISGSCFKTIFYCERTKTFHAKFIEPSQFIVPWNATDLETTPRYTQWYYESHSIFQRNQSSGFYIDDDISEPSQELISDIKKTIIEIEGSQENSLQGTHQHQIYKCSCDLELEDGYPYALPYMVWVERETQKVVRLQRNWKPDDEQQRRIVRDVHYRYAQGLGFYGYGIYHLLSGCIDANTEILRTIIDGGNISTRGGGFVSREAKLAVDKLNLNKKSKSPAAGTWQEVDSSPEDLSKAFYPIPTKEPSPALMRALEYLDGRGQSMAGTSGVLTGDKAMSNAPVGTVLALVEQASIQFSAIYSRLHNAQTQEFRILADVVAENIPDEGYPYSMAGKSAVIMASDFDERVDIVPVSTPDAASKSHRIMQANALAEITGKYQGMVDPRWVLEQVLNAMRVTVPEDKWIEQNKSNPLLDAQVAKLEAEVKRLEGLANESVANVANKNVSTVFSGVQAIESVLNALRLNGVDSGIITMIDEILKTAGFVDANKAPFTTFNGSDLGGQLDPNGIPQQNTSPQFPPIPQQPESAMPELPEPEQQPPMMATPRVGIETMQNEQL